MKPDVNRSVVHLDLDAFFVSVERIRDRRLEGKPLIIGGTGDRGVVASCSYEARHYGVRSAMPVRMARRLCPDAIVIAGDMDLYSRHSNEVTDIIREKSPLFEKASIDEFYIDLTGMEKYFGAYKWARELRAYMMKETGLPISFGLAVNKMVAKVATGEVKPNGQVEILSGEEAGFLAPLPVSRIPMAGEKTTRFLSNMGVRLISALREIPQHYLMRLLGKPGGILWQRAWGIDDTPVIPYSERKSISAERTFSQDTIDIRGMRTVLCSLTEGIAFRLRSEQKLTACVTVKIRYSDFQTLTVQQRIPYTSSDHVLSRVALELFEKLYDRRLLVRLIGVKFSHLIAGGHQISLFDNTESEIRLYEAIDRMKYKYGAGAVTRASAIGWVR